jgi:3',5'-cyclic AMP phosphodiesterase CpdA
VIIAQLSDIHAAPGNDNLSRFDRAMTWLDMIEPDVLVITGDLTDNNWLEGYAAISTCLDARSYPKLILPGNSDNRILMRSVWSISHWTDVASQAAMHFAADFGEIRLIGLDTTVPGSSAGSVSEHIPWLEQRLSIEGPTKSILFMHHHVFQTGISPMDQIMCGESVELGHFLRKNRRRLIAIATGHVHRPVAGSLAGIPAYICGSICPANPMWLGSETVPPANDPPSLMIHRFVDGALASHHITV